MDERDLGAVLDGGTFLILKFWKNNFQITEELRTSTVKTDFKMEYFENMSELTQRWEEFHQNFITHSSWEELVEVRV